MLSVARRYSDELGADRAVFYREGAGRGELFALLLGAPAGEVAGVDGDAEEVGGDEAELGGAEADDANDGAVDGGNDPALPEFLANEDGGGDGEHAGEIVQSNHVEHVQHVGLMSRGRSLLERARVAIRVAASFFL